MGRETDRAEFRSGLEGGDRNVAEAVARRESGRTRKQSRGPRRQSAQIRVAEAIMGGTGLGTEAREAATERAVLRMVALGVPAAQAARFGYADGCLGRRLSAFAE
jgi:hypothetical protein